jgi:hypothetical protein
MFFDAPTAFLTKLEEIFGDISISEWVKVFDQGKNYLKGCFDGEGEYL